LSASNAMLKRYQKRGHMSDPMAWTAGEKEEAGAGCAHSIARLAFLKLVTHIPWISDEVNLRTSNGVGVVLSHYVCVSTWIV
jgi:hypothetical protein